MKEKLQPEEKESPNQ